MKVTGSIIVALLIFALMLAGCQGIAGSHGRHAQELVPRNSVLQGYEGLGVARADRTWMEAYLGEY